MLVTRVQISAGPSHHFYTSFQFKIVPILQVALDLINEHRALTIAREAVEGGADWLEVGTPLIKSEGMKFLRKLKKEFPDKIIVADMKTMDTGALETEMASKSGADVVCIMGNASNETIKEAIRSARKYGSKIMVDLMGIKNKNKIKRAREVESFGTDYLCIHVAIDEQMVGKEPFKCIREIAEGTGIPIAVAGGLNSETAPKAIKNGASIIIVGGAITKARNAIHATEKIKKAILTGKKIKTDLFKKYDEGRLREVFDRVSSCNISDAMHRKGAMVGIHPIKRGYHLVGRAVTVKTMDGDWAKPIEAIAKSEKGWVVVVDAGGGKNAIWGELATWSCIKKGLAGAVIDGAVRDVQHIKEMDFPIFSRWISPSAGEPKGFGEIGSEIECGGQLVRRGDWIIGDDSGVVVVPKENAQEIANRAMHINEWENRVREEIKRGSSLSEVLKLEEWEKLM